MPTRTTNNRPVFTGTVNTSGRYAGAGRSRGSGRAGSLLQWLTGGEAFGPSAPDWPVSSNAEEVDDLLQSQLDSLSGLQRLTDSLGLTNFKGNIIANYKTAMDERDYNSIQSVVSREQAAGLNADLLGAQGSESDVAGNMMQGLQAQGSGAFLESFGQNILSFIQTGLSMAEGVLNFETLQLNKDVSVLGSSSGSSLGSEFIDALAGNFLSRSDSDLSAIQTVDELRGLSDNFIDEVVKSGELDYFKGAVRNKRLRNRLNAQMMRKLRSASGKKEFYDALTSGYKSHYNAKLQQAIDAASEGAQVEDMSGNLIDFFDGLADVMIKSPYMEALNNLKYLSESNPQLQAQAENAQNQYSSDYYNSASGFTAGQAANAAGEASQSQAQWAKALDDMRNQMLTFIDGEIAKCDTSTPAGKRMKTVLVMIKYVAPSFFGGSMLQMPSLPFSVKQDKSTHNNYNNSQTTSNIDTINSVHN